VIVRSGHGVFSNPEAVQEVIRILHLASRGKLINSDVSARAGRIVSPKRPRQKGRDGVEEKSAVLFNHVFASIRGSKFENSSL
jgi:hypothetical protein